MCYNKYHYDMVDKFKHNESQMHYFSFYIPNTFFQLHFLHQQ